MKAKSTVPKMPKSQKIMLNPIHRIQLSRSLLNNVDFVLYPQKINGSDPENLGQTDIPKLTLVKLLVQISADIAINPIILNALLQRVKSLPPHIKKFTVKTADIALKSSRKGSKKEAQIHQNEYNSRMDKVPTGLFPKLAPKPQGIYPDSLGQVTLNNKFPNSSFITVDPCFWGK